MVPIILLILIVGSVLFHIFTPWYSTPIASNWSNIDSTIELTFWMTGAVYVLILTFMTYCVIKYGSKKNRRAEYEPESKKAEVILTVLTTIGVAGLLAPGLIVWDEYVSPPEDAMPIEAMGQQWYWNFRLPGEDGILGTTDARNINADNPFGMNENDPNGRDDILIEGDALHLLHDKPVKFLLRSIDVLHNFYVPQFRAKMDLVPGMVTFYWIRPTVIGDYEILCAELCGVGHHAMRGEVLVDEASDYQEWLSEQLTFGEIQQQAMLEKNEKLALTKSN
ncbi:MAG: cytochrome c oxidase subunit II [Rhizobiales bacterium TMED168]|nr:MAG: cytochrome c oxidase subunit II [Rhizobiales bacterium TMED168]|tara:strand:+ start:89612 stop:90448 length:837 start_codon:yes stop_codon:yes gene_type:complete